MADGDSDCGCDMPDYVPEMPSCWSPAPSAHPDHATSRFDVLTKIESIFESMADILLNERGHLSIALCTSPTKIRTEPDLTVLPAAQPESIQQIQFPGRSEREAWRFAVVVRILELIHESLRQDVVISKRDIYYRDPALFGQQTHVDRYVDIIANTFNVPRSALHVTAAAKGLMTGCASFCRRDGTIVDTSLDEDGLLVPDLKDVLSVNMSSVKWILVVEKEATFRSVAASEYWTDLSTHGIMLTAKGYPDIATRALLKFLGEPSPQNSFTSPWIYCLVDFDPDGLAIFSSYKFGSTNLTHETRNLRVPQMQHFGLDRSHLVANNDSHASQNLLTLTVRDRRKARKMLAWDHLAKECDLRANLQAMLMLNVKAELQLLDAVPHGMSRLLKQGLPA